MSMPPKTERYEIRLEPETIGKVDGWRGTQTDLPSRSEAMRRLIETGLETSTTRQLFTAARFQILTAALTPGPADALPDAYIFAWGHEVYPGCHDNAPWHQPFAGNFRVSKDMLDDLTKLLDDGWTQKTVPTFYELEDHYGLRHGGSLWDRSKLIAACRYLHLDAAFDLAFWQQLLKKTQHPSEAATIVRPFDRQREIYLV